MMKEIELSKFHHSKHPHGYTEPFAIVFVYPKDGEPVMVKGMSHEVDKFVKETYPVALCHWTFWKNGKSRGHWLFTCPGKYITESRFEGEYDFLSKPDTSHPRFYISIYDGKKLVRKFSLRRIPKKWIPEFNTNE